jgi:putative membrane protein
MMECTTMMMDGMGMMVWGLVSFLLVLLVLFGFVLAVAYAVKRIWGKDSERASGRDDSALDLLKKRYVRGEINREEFDRTKKEIE